MTISVKELRRDGFCGFKTELRFASVRDTRVELMSCLCHVCQVIMIEYPVLCVREVGVADGDFNAGAASDLVDPGTEILK